jgi:hypothetical protein
VVLGSWDADAGRTAQENVAQLIYFVDSRPEAPLYFGEAESFLAPMTTYLGDPLGKLLSNMTTRDHSGHLKALAVLLTLIASGDDVSVYRMMFPSYFTVTSSSVPLPLDDPNSDFLAQGTANKGMGPVDGAAECLVPAPVCFDTFCWSCSPHKPLLLRGSPAPQPVVTPTQC